MWLRDHVRCHDFADSLSCGCAGVNSTTNSSNIAAHDGRHQTSVDLFPADETNVSRFHHRVGGFNHRDQATAFDHSECFRHQLPPSFQIVTKSGHKKAQEAQECFYRILCPFCAFCG